MTSHLFLLDSFLCLFVLRSPFYTSGIESKKTHFQRACDLIRRKSPFDPTNPLGSRRRTRAAPDSLNEGNVSPFESPVTKPVPTPAAPHRRCNANQQECAATRAAAISAAIRGPSFVQNNLVTQENPLYGTEERPAGVADGGRSKGLTCTVLGLENHSEVSRLRKDLEMQSIALVCEMLCTVLY